MLWFIVGAVGAQQRSLCARGGTQAEDPRESARSAESGRMKRSASHRCGKAFQEKKTAGGNP